MIIFQVLKNVKTISWGGRGSSVVKQTLGEAAGLSDNIGQTLSCIQVSYKLECMLSP